MTLENVIIKDWGKIDISFGLIYPNVYEIGMSSYSIRLLLVFLEYNYIFILKFKEKWSKVRNGGKQKSGVSLFSTLPHRKMSFLR